MAEKLALTVDPLLFDEVLKPYVDEVLSVDSRNFEMDQMAFGLHESEQYVTLVKDGIVAFEGESLETVVPTVLTHGFFLGLKYAEAREAKKISGEEEYRASGARVVAAAAPPKPHIRRVGKILGEEKSSGGKTQ